MTTYEISMKPGKRLVLLEHDRKKQDLVEWIKFDKGTLHTHNLFATLPTGKLIQ